MFISDRSYTTQQIVDTIKNVLKTSTVRNKIIIGNERGDLNYVDQSPPRTITGKMHGAPQGAVGALQLVYSGKNMNS